jgi:hypothetical protein
LRPFFLAIRLPALNFFTITSRTGPRTFSFSAQSPNISSSMRAVYSPGAAPGAARTGLTLWAIGIEGMSAPMLSRAPLTSRPDFTSFSTNRQS